MKNMVLSIMVVSTLLAAGIGGTFAGFVDTEESQGNFYQAGILDLLVNGKNDPIGAKLQYTHGKPCVSVDYWIDVLDWGECQGGNLYLRIKDIVSEEYGAKYHHGDEYVYDGVSPEIPDPNSAVPLVPAGYRPAVGAEPAGPGVWSSEPEKIAEVGGGYVGQIEVLPDNPCLMGEDYASGIADHLDLKIEVCDDDGDGTLDNADDNGDGMVDSTEYSNHNWIVVVSGKLVTFMPETKLYLGFLETQQISFIHCDVHLQQLECPGWSDPQTKYWPSNALQGDRAMWTFMFELTTD